MGDEDTELEEFRSDMEDTSQRDPAPRGDRITPMGHNQVSTSILRKKTCALRQLKLNDSEFEMYW